LLDGDDLIDNESGDEDEVFALKGLEDDGDDDSGEDEDIEMENLDGGEAREEPPTPKKKKKTQKRKQSSQSESSEELESEEEEETWGKSKSAYYSSNAAQLDSDDEEANELEEQEAKRLQAKLREDLEDVDFGLNDAFDITGIHTGTEYATMFFPFRLTVYFFPSKLPDNIPVVTSPIPQDTNSIIRHLEKTNPETLALTRDWEDTAYSLMETQAEIAK
jgi:U3 small nucleolar RNA-associated protein 3